MTLHFGVIPMEMPLPNDLDALVSATESMLIQKKLAAPGDRVAIVSGSSLGAPGTLNGVIIHTVSE